MKVAAVVLTNKVKLNPILIRSLSFADEIIVIVDSNLSSVILAKAGIHLDTKEKSKIKFKIFSHPLNSDFSAQRNFALEKTESDWVFFVDDDEYVSTELGLEIQQAIKNKDYSGYFIRRQDVVYHQPLNHGETGNIKILRLARRTSGKFIRPVHEVWKIKGRVGELGSPLYHQKNHFISEFIGRMTHYGPIDAKILNSEKKPFSWLRLLFNPLAKFILNYKLRGGFLDGYAGLFSAYLMSIQSVTVRIIQWENRK